MNGESGVGGEHRENRENISSDPLGLQ